MRMTSAKVRLTLSSVGGVVTARAAVTEPPAPLTKPSVPPIGSLIYGHPKLRKPSGLRGDYELGLLTKRGSAATGDGDISYILWLQRLWVRGDEAERTQTVETNERWPSSTVWQRTEVVGHCASLDGGTGGAAALVTRWDADEGAFFTRADAEGWRQGPGWQRLHMRRRGQGRQRLHMCRQGPGQGSRTTWRTGMVMARA